MKIHHAFCLMLFSFLTFAFTENREKIAGYSQSLTDSVKPITVSARFVKHVQYPCCCYIWIKGKDMFEITFVSNGKMTTRATMIEYRDCKTSSYLPGHYYTIIMHAETNDYSYQDIVKYNRLDSIKRKIKADLAPGVKLKSS